MCQSQSKVIRLRARVDKKGNAEVARQGGRQPLCIVSQVVMEEPGNVHCMKPLFLKYKSHLEFVFSWDICS